MKNERKQAGPNNFLRRTNPGYNQTVTQNFLNQSIDSNYRSQGSSLERHNPQAIGSSSGRNTMMAGADGGQGATPHDFVSTFFPSVNNSK